MSDSSWHDSAACKGLGHLFFPVEGKAEPADGWGPAKAVCASCPVFAECDAEQDRNRDMHGMRAGRVPPTTRVAASPTGGVSPRALEYRRQLERTGW